MNLSRHLAIIGFFTFLICHNAADAAPSGACSDQVAKALVVQSFFNRIKAQVPAGEEERTLIVQAVRHGTEISIEGIRTTSKDPALRKNACAAELVVSLNEPIRKLLRENPLAIQELRNSGVTVSIEQLRSPIKYETQVTDDGKDIYIQVTGINTIADVSGMAAIIIEQRKSEQLSRSKPDTISREAADRVEREKAAAAGLPPEVKLANWKALVLRTFDSKSCVSPDDYPAAALRARAEGVVRVLVEVDAKGFGRAASVLESSGNSREHKMLDRRTIEAVQNCTYPKPPDGQSANIEISYTWKLTN